MKRSSGVALVLAAGLCVLAGIELLATRDARPTRGSETGSSIATRSEEPPGAGAGSEDPGAKRPMPDGRAPASTDASSTHPARFLGFVSDTLGRPIAGARISIQAAGPPNSGRSKGVGETGSDGQFTISMDVGTAGEFTVLAEAEGYASSKYGGRNVVPDHLISMQLATSFRLHVALRDAETRAPLAGVETYVDGSRFLSDAAGHVEASALTVARATSIRTRLAGYANEEKQVLVSEPGDHSVDVELWRETPIEIEVVDGESGAPMPDVAVRLGADEVRTDGAGRFTTGATAGHELPVMLSRDEYWRLLWNWTPDSLDRARTIRLPMKRKSWVQGRITDASGVPVPGAKVELRSTYDYRLLPKDQERWGPPGRVCYDSTTRPAEAPPSDAEGLYRVALPPSSRALSMRVGCAGYVPFVRDPFVAAEETERGSFDLVLRRAAAIRGRVLSDVPRPEPARVIARDANQEIVGAAGVGPPMTYVLDSIPEGDLRLALEDATSSKSIVAVDVHVEAGQTLEHDFTWPTEAPVELGTVSGRVASAGGALPPDVRIFAEAVGAIRKHLEPETVGADGTFTLRLPAGVPHRLRAYSRIPRYAESEPRVATPDASGVELRLPQIGVVCLRLLDAGTGAPLSLRTSEQYDALRIRRSGGSTWERRSLVVDLDGRSCVELPLGDYDLCVHLGREGFLPVVLEKISPKLGAEPSPHDLRLERGIDARVRFVGPADGPAMPAGSRLVFLLEQGQLASVEGPFAPGDPRVNSQFGGDHGVSLRIDDDAVRMQLLDREDFYFDGATLRGLRPGRYFVKAFPDDLEFAPAEFEIRGPGKAEVVIAWRPK